MGYSKSSPRNDIPLSQFFLHAPNQGDDKPVIQGKIASLRASLSKAEEGGLHADVLKILTQLLDYMTRSFSGERSVGAMFKRTSSKRYQHVRKVLEILNKPNITPYVFLALAKNRIFEFTDMSPTSSLYGIGKECGKYISLENSQYTKKLGEISKDFFAISLTMFLLSMLFKILIYMALMSFAYGALCWLLSFDPSAFPTLSDASVKLGSPLISGKSDSNERNIAHVLDFAYALRQLFSKQDASALGDPTQTNTSVSALLFTVPSPIEDDWVDLSPDGGCVNDGMRQ